MKRQFVTILGALLISGSVWAQPNSVHFLSFGGTKASIALDDVAPTEATALGRWYIDAQDGGITMRFVLEIKDHSLIATNTCYYPNGLNPISASVEVPSTLFPNELVVERGDAKETVVDQNGGTARCHVAVQATTMPYRLEGNTLHFYHSGSNEELVLNRY